VRPSVGSKEAVRPKESQVQAAIVDALTLAGFTVLVTSQIQATKGASVGIADLIVQHEVCGPSALMLEVKRPGPVRYSSPEQEALAKKGLTKVVQSAHEAVGAAYWWLVCEFDHKAIGNRGAWQSAMDKAERARSALAEGQP
jgi:hypothetical protein